jgi:hypothetical protein
MIGVHLDSRNGNAQRDNHVKRHDGSQLQAKEKDLRRNQPLLAEWLK